MHNCDKWSLILIPFFFGIDIISKSDSDCMATVPEGGFKGTDVVSP